MAVSRYFLMDDDERTEIFWNGAHRGGPLLESSSFSHIITYLFRWANGYEQARELLRLTFETLWPSQEKSETSHSSVNLKRYCASPRMDPDGVRS